MFKRRRGVIVKCAALIAAFWFGFAIYVNTLSHSYDDGRSAPSATHTVRENAGQHSTMPSTSGGLDWLNGREDDRAKRDRELQERFRRDQTKLQELLDGKKTPVVAAKPASDPTQYDPQTASLIRLGLIVPKWNLNEEVPEHLGAPGKVIRFVGTDSSRGYNSVHM